MCHSAIPAAETEIIRACASCGADLTRWIPKPPKLAAVAAAAAAAPPVQNAGAGNLGLGILGAVLGASVGVGVMFGFYLLVGFRFPWLGVGTGFLTGMGARLLYKGGEEKLGMISAGIAAPAVIGTLFLIYGQFPILSIISVIVSISVAYRTASR
jgi:hypothetical protein